MALRFARPDQCATPFWSNGFGADRQLEQIFLLHVQGARYHPLNDAVQRDYAGYNALEIDPDSVQG
jgi:hypothetical protein